MNHILKIQILFLLTIALPAWGLAQDRISFTATADAKQMTMDDYLGLSFTLYNANGKQLKLPHLKGFKVVSGPNTSTKTTGINGKWERTTTHTYYLQPLKVGKHNIGSASIKVGNKTYRSKPLTVEVMPKSDKLVSDDKKLLIKTEVSTTEAVPGEAIILDQKAYFAVDVDHFNIAEEPDYSGFFVSDIRRFNNHIVKEVIDGIPYRTRIIKRLVLYPQQVGTLRIDPISVAMAVPVGNAPKPDPNDPFSFLNSRTRPTQRFIVKSKPIEIKVKPLPAPTPPSFSGAVGRYTATAALDKNKADTDDAITLQITVSGNGDIKRVTAPELVLSDTFEVYEPRLSNEQQGEQDGELFGVKTFDYLILPKYPGKYSLSPKFSYYSPDSSKFVSVKMDDFQVFITKGKHSSNVNVPPPVKEETKREIRTVKASVTSRGERAAFFGSALFWVLLALPFLLLGLGAVYKYIQANRPEIDPVLEKSKQAQRVAKQRLAAAEKHLNAGEERQFYDEVSKSLIGYVIDKFNIPGSELSKRNVREKLHASGADARHVERFMELMNACEVAIFAGKTGNTQQTYDAAKSVIVDVEQSVY